MKSTLMLLCLTALIVSCGSSKKKELKEENNAGTIQGITSLETHQLVILDLHGFMSL